MNLFTNFETAVRYLLLLIVIIYSLVIMKPKMMSVNEYYRAVNRIRNNLLLNAAHYVQQF